jgi:hypothetical protein
MNRSVVSIVLVIIASFPTVTIADDSEAQKALKGLSGALVLIEGMDVGATRLGLTKEELQTDTELKLRLAGMQVLTNEQAGVGAAMLYVNVNILSDASSANIAVSLRQDVRLYRDSNIILSYATTWEKAFVVTHPVRSQVRGVVKDEVDAFLNLWLTANPKPRWFSTCHVPTIVIITG